MSNRTPSIPDDREHNDRKPFHLFLCLMHGRLVKHRGKNQTNMIRFDPKGGSADARTLVLIVNCIWMESALGFHNNSCPPGGL